jgi:hypothetical protein
MSISHLRVTLLTLTVAAVAALGVAAAPASATSLVSCTVGSEHLTLTPGVTNTPQTVTVAFTDTYGSPLVPCVSSDPTVTGGTAVVSFPLPDATCQDPLTTLPGSQVITWSNGQRSTFSFETTITEVEGETVSTNTGTITAGEFAGGTAEETIVQGPPNPLACLTPGGARTLDGLMAFEVV